VRGCCDPPSSSVKSMFGLATEAEVHAFWDPRIGPEAAHLQWRVKKLNGYLALIVLLITVPCLVVGASLHLPTVLAVALLSYGAVGWIQVRVVVLTRRSGKITGRLLGVNIGFLHERRPPQRTKKYLAWCGKNGIVPFAAALDRPEMPSTV
jgi:hypothetical protein